jgi:ubiquinone biosynthesis protein
LVNYLEENKQYSFIHKLIPSSTRKFVSRYSKWAKMRLVCEELGPTFVKFGQILSNRPDLVPLALTFELEKLQDNVPPMSEMAAKEVVETELKDKVETLFAWFEPIPFASASMAQVHKVTLHSGDRVALKIQRAGIYDVITEDLKVMYKIAHILEKRIPSIKSFDPIGLVKNFENSILKELDFIHESINVQRFYNNLEKDQTLEQFAHAPKVYQKYTTSKVLALEFISGIKIDRILDLKEKNLKDKTKLQLEIFLNNLSKDELERFKTAEDLKQMIMNIAVIKLEENPNLTLPDIEEIKPHIIESMFKRYIDNA